MSPGAAQDPARPGRGLGRELLRAPNLLSLARLPLGALVWVAPSHVAFVLTLLGLAALTDVLDGVVARHQQRGQDPGSAQRENIGAWLDPLCDKAFVASALVAVWLALGPPWWLALVATTREVLVALLLLVKWLAPSLRGRVIPYRAMLAGKATTAAQFGLFVAVLLDARDAWPWLAVSAGVLGLAAGLQYFARAVRTLGAPP